jgi:excisionase family DNA binding protein
MTTPTMNLVGSSGQSTSVEGSEFLTIEEASTLLRCSKKALYAAIRAHELPGVVRIGRVIRIRRSALLKESVPSS